MRLSGALKSITTYLAHLGDAVFFLRDIVGVIMRGRVRMGLVMEQAYAQGVQSLTVIVLSALASGMVLGLQGFVTLERFGAKEFVARLVALSLLRELGPVFTALIFSGKSGAGVTAELGTMNTNEQIQATRAMGVDPIELLVVPRFLACLLVLPCLLIVTNCVGILGGYLIEVMEGNLPGAFYMNATMTSIKFVDFFSGFIKTFFFSIIVAWICCYQGFFTSGGALGVGRFTTQAVAYTYISVIISNAVLTKMIITFWG